MSKSQFNYYSFVWMFLSIQSYNSLNKLQERASRALNNDQKRNFQDLICKYKELTIHQGNLQTLVMEVYKIIDNTVQPFMNSLFLFHENVHNI